MSFTAHHFPNKYEGFTNSPTNAWLAIVPPLYQ